MPSRLVVLRWTVAPFRHASRWLRGAPRWLQVAIGLVLVAGMAAGTYYLLHKRAESQRHRAVAEAWQHFEIAAKAGDVPAMKAALDEVLAVAPDQVLAQRRRQTLETFDADAGDEPMVLLTIRLNLRANDLPAAAREADKRLEKEPRDWLARCIKATDAMTRGDRVAVDAALDALPSPDDPRSRLDPSGLLLAFRLYRATGRPTAPLRAVVQSRVVAVLRAPTVQNLAPSEKVGIVECYLEGFEPATDKPQPPPLVHAWAAASDLADTATDQAAESGTVPVLLRVGRMAQRQAHALFLFRQHNQISAEQFSELNRELEARTRRAWEAVRTREPKNHESYLGMAWSHLRAQDYAAGREWTVRGLSECGDDPQLAGLFSRLLQLEGRPQVAWAALAAAARAHPDKPIWWALAAQAAITAGRRDLALEACASVRKIDPSNRWAARTEATLWLAAGDANRAAQLLHQLGEPALAADPGTARAYTRALSESGLDSKVEGFLALAEDTAVKANSPTPIEAALRGWLDAPAKATRSAAVAGRAERLLADRWPDAPELFRLRADALACSAELASPPWDPIRVRAAIQAYDRLRAKLPEDPGVAFGLALLRLYGEDNPEQAARDLAPLLAAETSLTPAQAEVVGQVYRRNGKPVEAVRVLEKAVASPDATTGCHIQLALAYHATGQSDSARQTLVRASSRPRTAREHGDYVAAVGAIKP